MYDSGPRRVRQHLGYSQLAGVNKMNLIFPLDRGTPDQSRLARILRIDMTHPPEPDSHIRKGEWYVNRLHLVLVMALAGIVNGPIMQASAQEGGKEKPKDKSPTKIAVLDMKVVFSEYARANDLRDELERAGKPFQDKAERLRDEIKAIEAQGAKPGVDIKTKYQCEDAARKCRFDLEGLAIELKRALIEKHEQNLETVKKEVAMATKAVADAYGF